jgi:hypothetical protein
VESKLLEWLRSGAASWCGGRDGLLLECGDLDCCVFAEDGGGSDRIKGRCGAGPGFSVEEVHRAPPDDVPFGLDPVLWGWWLLRLVNATWLEASALKSGLTDGVLLLLRRRRRTCVLGSCGRYPLCVVLLIRVPNMYGCVYKYKLCMSILFCTLHLPARRFGSYPAA